MFQKSCTPIQPLVRLFIGHRGKTESNMLFGDKESLHALFGCTATVAGVNYGEAGRNFLTLNVFPDV